MRHPNNAAPQERSDLAELLSALELPSALRLRRQDTGTDVSRLVEVWRPFGAERRGARSDVHNGAALVIKGWDAMGLLAEAVRVVVEQGQPADLDLRHFLRLLSVHGLFEISRFRAAATCA